MMARTPGGIQAGQRQRAPAAAGLADHDRAERCSELLIDDVVDDPLVEPRDGEAGGSEIGVGAFSDGAEIGAEHALIGQVDRRAAEPWPDRNDDKVPLSCEPASGVAEFHHWIETALLRVQRFAMFMTTSESGLSVWGFTT